MKYGKLPQEIEAEKNEQATISETQSDENAVDTAVFESEKAPNDSENTDETE